MKIDISNLTNTTSNPAGNRVTRIEKSAPAPSSSVTLSDASSKIQALEAEARQATGFDEARVAAIKEAIQEGRFQINSKMIADKLLTNVRELISQQG